MAADSPWTKVFHDEALQGAAAANLSAEEFGVYWTILLLIASRGAPIEDDRQWLARRCNISTRRLNQIMDRLAAIPNKLVVRNGMIGNHKMLGVVRERDKKSDQARRAAHARWHGDDPELPLEDPSPPSPARARTGSAGSSDLSREKVGEKSEINRAKKDRKPQKTAVPADAGASPPVRARDSELRESTQPNPSQEPDVVGDEAASPGGSGELIEPEVPKPPLLRDQDLAVLYDAVCDASGFATSSPQAINRAMSQVEAWRADGIDFDEVVVPTIRRMTANSTEPTRLLSRFDKLVRLEHAKRRGANGSGQPYRAPAEPVTLRAGEDDRLRQLRERLLAALGSPAYVRLANKVSLTVVEERNVVRVNDPRVPYLLDEHRALVTRCAKAAGFKEVW